MRNESLESFPDEWRKDDTNKPKDKENYACTQISEAERLIQS